MSTLESHIAEVLKLSAVLNTEYETLEIRLEEIEEQLDKLDDRLVMLRDMEDA